jgi:hypothetical protein
MLGSNDKMPLPAIASRQAAFSRTGIKNIPASFIGRIRLRHDPVRNNQL